MQKIVLVFVPGASPTYVPLGIASLSAYLKQRLPTFGVEMRDLNIDMWHARFRREGKEERVEAFFMKRTADFFDEGHYRHHQERLSFSAEHWCDLESSLSRFLKQEAQSEALEWYDDAIQRCLGLEGDEILALSAAFPGQLLHAVVVARLVKRRHPGVTILLGGAALSSIDVNALLSSVGEIASVCRGEGEAGIVACLLGTPSASIRGWSFRRGIATRHNPMSKGVVQSELPAPELAALPLDRYLNPELVLPVLFSRGCRWRRCRFCCHNASFAGYRARAYPLFVDQLAKYHEQLGARCFYFADQYISAEDLEGIGNEILRRHLEVRFHVMGRPTGDYTRRRLDGLFAAGCRWISWGVESGSVRLLEECDKGTNPKAIARVIRDAKSAGINNLAMMIFGLPGTSEAAFQETLDFATDISDGVDAFTMSSFQLFEKTRYFKDRAQLGLVLSDREVLFESNGQSVCSTRWSFTMTDSLGARQVPPATAEIAKWKQWQLFVRGGARFFETLPAEHYLLMSAQRAN